MALKDIVTGLFKPAADLISEFIPDKDLRAQLNSALATAQIALQEKFVELEMALAAARAQIITAEANSQSWLARNWRPITMLTFVGLIVARWFGFTAEGIDAQLEIELMALIKIGLGGYVVGRSAEKIVPQVAEIIGKK